MSEQDFTEITTNDLRTSARAGGYLLWRMELSELIEDGKEHYDEMLVEHTENIKELERRFYVEESDERDNNTIDGI